MHRSLCICGLIQPIATRTRVVLLLHQLEQEKPTNTGRLAARCLSNSVLIEPGDPAEADTARHPDRGPAPAPEGGRRPAWDTPGADALLLFPHPEARPLENWRDSARPVVLVVPDGTWRQAKKARRRIAGLEQLPCAILPAAGPSSYRLRQAARPDRLATIEALARAMGILEGPEVQRHLEHIFRVMVDRTLWTNGRISTAAVTGGIPFGVQSHDPMGMAKLPVEGLR
jgi:DTW domain-containing protein YfiP